MPAPIMSEEEWLRIVAVYSKHEGRLSSIARELGWPIARTTRLYKNGYPSRGWPPIKTLLARDAFSAAEIRAERALLEEKLPPVPKQEELPVADEARAVVISTAEQARIAAMVKREEDRERARQDAIKSRAAEATLVSINRGNAIALNAMTASLLRGATQLSLKLQKELESAQAVNDLTMHQKLHLVRAVASIARFNSEATVMAVKAERLVLGDPIDADDEAPQADAGNLDEAAMWIETASKALNKARLRGLIASGGRGR